MNIPPRTAEFINLIYPPKLLAKQYANAVKLGGRVEELIRSSFNHEA